ncbi:biogenesis of lysosome-related organelles complex 1 subunit 4 [Chelonus insularis]|uniref:biogenesis of lysosome-related organelles complex 1 subunit 4 n=1 Tax=Chelonus insularis TaxID=460826 RepID=UPI001588A47F|nr:biogenesis of lysosome-related organelles complex 1 subunit 4-like [Chelonus insularis]
MPELKMNNQANDKMIETLANDYSSFMKVDLPSQTKKVHETVDEMMVRLEEFESIVGMVQNLRAECTYEHLIRFRSVNPQLMELCRRIDALEHVVARASIDLTNLEAAVDNAEAELGANTTVSDRLRGIFSPLSFFRSKTPENSTAFGGPSTASPKRSDNTIDLPPIFRTKDAFKSPQ